MYMKSVRGTFVTNIPLVVMTLVAVFAMMITAAWHTSTVSAACTVPATNYGTATTTLSVPTDGTYRLWARIKAPDTVNNTFMLDVNGGTCFTVGGAIEANAWKWVDYQNATTTSKINLTLKAGTQQVKLIGNQPNVSIDRIILTADLDCVPTLNSTGDNCASPPDTTAPSVVLTAPVAGATLSGNQTFTATATDDTGGSGIAKVEFYIDGVLKASDTTAPSPFTYSFDTLALANGTHTVMAKAYDKANNIANSASVTVTVSNGDTKPPSVSLNGITEAATITGVAAIGAQATDDKAISKVEFYLDGVLARTETGAPYCLNGDASGVCHGWDSTTVMNGAHSLVATAYDSSGNKSSAMVNFTVKNGDTTAPSVPSSVTARAAAYNRIDVSWAASTDDVGVAKYCISRSDGKNICPTGTSVTYADTSVLPSATYAYRVSAYDAASNVSALSTAASATTPAAPDTSAPTVPTGLSASAVSSSQVTLAWTASTDNIGVTGYDIYNGTAKIATTTSASYGVTGLAANTSYTFYVAARDSAGNISAKSSPATTTTHKTSTTPYGSLAGIISSDQSSLSWAYVTTTVDGWSRYYRFAGSGSQASYTINGLVGGSRSFAYSAKGLKSQAYTLTIDPGQVTTKNVKLVKK